MPVYDASMGHGAWLGGPGGPIEQGLGPVQASREAFGPSRGQRG